jgi:RNA polymerase sigma-70 factor (ECF subfamily)
MLPESSFQAWLERLGSCEQNAAAVEVFNRFAGRLLGVARQHLDARLRRLVDPEDVMQSVLKSFFLRQADKPFDLRNWDQLWSLLFVMTVRRCARKHARYYGPVHDLARDQAPAADGSAAEWAIIGNDPTPEQAALLAELLDAVMRPLNGRQQDLQRLGQQGYTVPEIAEQVGYTEYSVEGVLKQIRKKLHRLVEEADGAA